VRITFDNVGDVGIIKDASTLDLPMNAWTDGNNVQFVDGKVQKIKGYEAVFGTPTVAPYYVTPVQKASNLFYFYASLTTIYGTDGTSHNEMLSATANATADINWNGGLLGGGVSVFNNGVDAPWVWTGTTLNDYFAALANWPASMVARIIRPYKQYLIAGDIDEGAGRDGDLLRWSHPAAVGSVPSSWDYTDLTKDAGRVSLADGGGFIVEMERLFDTNYIYKENATHSMNYIGGNSTFAFRTVFDQLGILSRRCVKPFKGMHFVVGSGDVVLHDGRSHQYPLHRKQVDWMYDNIDGTNGGRTFVSVNHNTNEVWICFPKTGASFPNAALVWNWKDNTTSQRDLPNGTAHIAWGLVDPGQDASFDGMSGTFEDQNYQIDRQVYSSSVRSMLLCDTTLTKFYRTEETEQAAGTNINAFIERSGVPLGRQGANGIDYDPSKMKFVREIWPVIQGTPGGIVKVEVGVRQTQEDSISWEAHDFVIGTDYVVYVRQSGRLIDIRFSSDTDITWDLINYGVEFELGSVR